jgi:DNA-3-methyladenine glycosylase I
VTARCQWVGEDPLSVAYHDREWGLPVHDDRVQFEFLILEGAQAGLSWITILRKRESYRKAFAGFDPAAVARFGARDVRRLLGDAGIVRNRLKIEGAIRNAKAFLAVQQEFGSFDRFVWQFVGGRPKRNAWTRMGQVPPRSPESDALSKALKQRGFTFVGSTICYAHMQAVGMVNDHTVDCFRYRQVSRKGPRS